MAGRCGNLVCPTRFAGHSPAFAEKYWQIYEYIGSHPEAQKKIYAALKQRVLCTILENLLNNKYK